MKKNWSGFLIAFAVFCFSTVQAKENVENPNAGNSNARVAAGCQPATAQTDLDINNIRTTIMAGGDMWWDLNDAKYEIPKGSGKHSMFAGALWIAGESDGGQLKVAAMTYRQDGSDFWTGPLDPATASISETECAEWDKHFKISREEVDAFLAYLDNPSDFPTYETPASILEWPAKGNVHNPIAGDRDIAPFTDVNGDGVYNPDDGDYPDYNVTGTNDNARLFGDQTLFWVFNDKGNVHTESDAEPIGLEIHAQAFGFATDDEINDMTFYNYKIINRATTNLNETYFGQWVDPDLGFYLDDFVGCDVGRGLGYCYNGDAEDEGVRGYGLNPPAIAVDFFQGPLADPDDGIDNDRDCIVDEDGEQIIMSNFTYYNNDFTVYGNPEEGQDFYNYLKSIWKNNVPFTYGGNGDEGTVECRFMFPGDSDPIGWGVQPLESASCSTPMPMPAWDEETAGNVPFDRRFLQSAGPFTLQPGDVNEITVGVIWARATSGGPMASVNLARVFDDEAQALFNNNFKVVDGPDAPDLNIVEMDKELILYLTNDKISNNYQENYVEKDPYISNSTDTNYVFQGYKVYQCVDGTVSASELDNPDRARLIFQCDIEDGVDQIINHYFDLELDAWMPIEEVNGLDAGIAHSFSVTEDQFATGDPSLVNYKRYYFTAIAYAFNASEINANPYNPDDGQNQPYLQGRRNIITYEAIPHNTLTNDGGTFLNSMYGDGVEITRIEGTGNGSNALMFTEETMDAIIAENYIDQPTYQAGNGPIDVKIIDPTSVKDGSYQVKFDGVDTESNWVLIDLESMDTLATSDKSIGEPYEQIIYDNDGNSVGFSLAVNQVTSPEYENPVNGSAYSTIVGSGVSGLTGEVGFIEGSISFDDDYARWLSGVKDEDGVDSDWATNWIRSGSFEYDFGDQAADDRTVFNDYQYGAVTETFVDGDGNESTTLLYYKESDINQEYEDIIDGTWAPYKFTSHFHDGPGVATPIHEKVDLGYLSSVDVVFTNDKELWSRCIVLESQDLSDFAEGYNANGSGTGLDSWCKMYPRRHASVGQDGNPDGTGNGMGWFPGYAVNLETGERLNIMFAEDSRLVNDNGNDMLFNPSGNQNPDVWSEYEFDGTNHNFGGGTWPLGGKHFVYVMNSIYDGCESYMDLAEGDINVQNGGYSVAPTPTNYLYNVFKDAMWVGFPLLAPNQELLSVEDGLIPTKTTVSLRVKRPYENLEITNVNGGNPVYEFATANVKTIMNNEEAADSALAMINIVPNPYYAYSGYETGQLDNRVKLINLPNRCDISIYTVGGELVRTLDKDDPTTSFLDWDLKNEFRVPVASGVYIVHVSAKDETGSVYGERVLKWFGVMRPIDLDTF